MARRQAAAIRLRSTRPLVLYFSTHSTYLWVSELNNIGANGRRINLPHRMGSGGMLAITERSKSATEDRTLLRPLLATSTVLCSMLSLCSLMSLLASVSAVSMVSTASLCPSLCPSLWLLCSLWSAHYPLCALSMPPASI
jgi:hypothetical protein